MSWKLACPRCAREMGPLPKGADTPAPCPACASVYRCRDGVWDFLPANRAARFERFLDQYATVRRSEGRGAQDPEHYRRLPDCPRRHPLAWEWRIRSRSFQALVERVLISGRRPGTPLRVLDLGAGNGWLSYRLAELGHDTLAVDLSLDARDGLLAARHYAALLARPFPRLRAEFDRLPLTAGQADAVVFNASFHYSADYEATLREALRVLDGRGVVVIMDSPIYRHRTNGEAMVAERKARFERLYGFASDSMGSREFLTDGDLKELGDRTGVVWQRLTPWYGVRWALRAWRARLRVRGRRERARFALLVGRAGAARPRHEEIGGAP